MGKRLSDNLSSAYIDAANRLNGKQARRKIIAYVEAYDDIFFWRTVLSGFENEERYFEVMLPSRLNLTKGKRSVLMNLVSQNIGENMIACVDADYDYLLQGTTPLSDEVINNPYVFHTYAYAIENLQCYAPSLHDVTVAVTLNDHSIFNFEEFLKLYSESIHPLFVWSIWHYRKVFIDDLPSPTLIGLWRLATSLCKGQLNVFNGCAIRCRCVYDNCKRRIRTQRKAI